MNNKSYLHLIILISLLSLSACKNTDSSDTVIAKQEKIEEEEEEVWPSKEELKKQLGIEAPIIQLIQEKFPDNLFYYYDNGLVFRVDIENSEIKEFPKELKKLKYLHALMIKNTQITDVPEWILDLDSLKRVMISENKIETVPEALNRCKQLTYINLGGNPIKTFKLDSVLPNLESLALYETEITEFPIIRQAEGSPALELDLDKTLIKRIPKEVASMRIKELSMRENILEYIAPELGDVKELEKLDFYHSRHLKGKFPKTLNQCKNIKDIELEWCALEEFPMFVTEMDSLYLLGLDNNLIEEIPSEIGNLKNLYDLSLRDNKLSTVPKELNQLKGLSVLMVKGNPITHFPAEMFDVERENPCVIYVDGIPKGGMPVPEEQFNKGYEFY